MNNYPNTYWQFRGFPTEQQIADFHLRNMKNSWDLEERAAALDAIETLRLKAQTAPTLAPNGRESK